MRNTPACLFLPFSSSFLLGVLRFFCILISFLFLQKLLSLLLKLPLETHLFLQLGGALPFHSTAVLDCRLDETHPLFYSILLFLLLVYWRCISSACSSKRSVAYQHPRLPLSLVLVVKQPYLFSQSTQSIYSHTHSF